MDEASADELRDELPDDLNPTGFEGAYRFPDNSRRRVPGTIYLVLAAISVGIFFGFDGLPIANVGFLWGAVLLAAVGVFCFVAGFRMQIDEKQALVEAQNAIGFAVGHASAQQVWHGVLSRPTWRILCYSAEDPPSRRGLVLIDAVDGKLIEQLVQNNLDDWDG